MMPQTRSRPAPAARQTALPIWRVGDGMPPAGGFVALVPGAEAPLIVLGLPGSLKGAAREDVARRQALDRLGADGRTLDIRPARLGSADGWSRVAVADRDAVTRWRGALGAAAVRCRGLLPDYAALPVAPGLWVLAQEGDQLCVRLGPGDGFSAESALAEQMIVQALQQARATNTLPRAVLVLGAVPDTVAARLDGLAPVRDAAELPATVQPRQFAHGELSLDFIRDPRADASALEARVRRLVWPLALLALGAASWAGATALATRHDRAAAAAIEAQTLAAARRDLLGAAPILDLRVQVTREIERRRGATSAIAEPLGGLALLQRAALALSESPATVLGVALDQGIDGVALDLLLEDFRALDAVTAALGAAGVQASIARSAIAPEGGVSATVSVIGGRP